MTIIRKMGQKGVEYSGILENTNDPGDVMGQSLEDYSNVYVIFTKPDMTRITKTGEIVDDDADLTNGANIVWKDTDASQPSVLDMSGSWEYTVAARYTTGAYVISPFGIGFEVVR